MKEMMKKVKERREGFTMAELLIVVAIVAVLVAIAIPVFNGQLEKSREATDVANIRNYYAEISTRLLDESLSATNTTATLSGGTTATYAASGSNGDFTVTVSGGGFKVNQSTAQWQSGVQEIAGCSLAATTDMVGKTKIVYTFTNGGNGNYYLSSITFDA